MNNEKDTIYRQAAIDEIRRFSGYLDEDMINRIHIGLNRLPSAQPSYTDEQIQKMQELEQAEIEKAFQLGMESAQPEPIRLRLDHELSKEEYERLKKDCAEQPIILLPKESAQQWIPCSEQLPKKENEEQRRNWYLTTNAYGSVNITKYEFDGDFGFVGWGTNRPLPIRIIAWMPLPEPYKSED